jgi:hypothetical protein
MVVMDSHRGIGHFRRGVYHDETQEIDQNSVSFQRSGQ